VKTSCRILEVSRSGYYKWIKWEPTLKHQRTQKIQEEAKRCFEENHGAAGYRGVHKDMEADGIECNKETVRIALKKQGLQASQAKRFVPTTTDSDHNLPIAKNVLNRNFTASRPDEKWVGDITYIRTGESWVYLAVVIDLYSRKIVGWAMADHMRKELVLEAFEMAIQHRRPTGSLIFHSDRGSQYASDKFREQLEFLNVTQSMSRKGNCWDNAVAESFFGKLKTEWVGRYEYNTRDEAMRSIYYYIEMYYNCRRRHAAIGYLSPNDFEALGARLAA
jgi:putative transposase